MAVLQHHKHCSLANPQCCHILFLFQIFASLPLTMSEQGRNSHWRGRDQPVHACILCWRLAQGRTLIACPAPFQGMKEACFLPILSFCLLQKNFMNIKPYCCAISTILLEQNLTRAEGILMDVLFQTFLSVWYLAGRGKSDWGVLGTSYCWGHHTAGLPPYLSYSDYFPPVGDLLNAASDLDLNENFWPLMRKVEKESFSIRFNTTL